MEDDRFLYRYFTMYYNSALSFALVEVNPRTPSQLPAMLIILMLNALINATIFGIFIDLLSIVQSKAMEKMNVLDDVNEVMGSLADLPVDLEAQVRGYLAKTSEYKSQQIELGDFLKSLRD